jgi:hypothetical protein
MMQADRVLIEASVSFVRGRAADQNSRAAANAVQGFFIAQQSAHFQKMAELFPKRQAASGIVYGEMDVRNPVNGDGHYYSLSQ